MSVRGIGLVRAALVSHHGPMGHAVRAVSSAAFLVLVACSNGSSQADRSTSPTTVATAVAAADTTSIVADPTAAPTTAASGANAPIETDYDTPSGAVRLECAGSSDTAVILLAGGNDPPSVWANLVAALGESVLTCRFDPAIEPTGMTPSRRADALSAALVTSGMPGPYVLVGHSLGGLTVRQFGASHPEQLAGAVLLDATTPTALVSAHADLEAAGWDAVTTQIDADAPAIWPTVPLQVLAHDPSLLALGSDALEATWTEGQRAYATLSPLGRYEAVPGSGHFVYVDAVERVVAAIKDVLAAA